MGFLHIILRLLDKVLAVFFDGKILHRGAFWIAYNKTVSKSVLFETVRFTNYIIAKGFCNVQSFSDFFILMGLFETFEHGNDIFLHDFITVS